MFNYLVSNRYGAGTATPVILRGLDPGKKYSVKEINLFPGTRSSISGTAVYSGNYLMTVGINPDLNARRQSVVLEIAEVR